jgi:hypothetical protein
VMEASAAASSTTARIMMLSPRFERSENIVHDMFLVNDTFKVQRSWLTSARGARRARMHCALNDLEGAMEQWLCDARLCVASRWVRLPGIAPAQAAVLILTRNRGRGGV